METDKAASKVEAAPFHMVTIHWERGEWSGVMSKYSRDHEWIFAGRLKVKASDPLAPQAYRNVKRMDPLKSYVATVASAHMLAWLHAAFSHEVEVESYLDTTEMILEQLPEGRVWVSEIIIRPRIEFASNHEVKPEMIAHFHDLARRDCFIAQSIKTKVSVRSP